MSGSSMTGTSVGAGRDAAMSGMTIGNGSTKPVDGTDRAKAIVNPGESNKVQPGKKSSPAECQTCKERKYQDGSDENVSFKAAAHISPQAAGAAVRAHEGEHVSNAYSKAAKDGGKVLQASVAIHTAICPECGRSYVSGGTTTTKIKYGNEKNPYVQNMKNADRGILSGMNFDAKG
ncbi:MAG: hypothetical protein KBS96_04180 [Lachnospiraceae bacterium]|nr:hypothetical protein [Candidatus Colinaster scatohippi]